jgi:hypothetical protein
MCTGSLRFSLHTFVKGKGWGFTTPSTTTRRLDELQLGGSSGGKGHPNGQTVGVDEGEARFSRKRVVEAGKGKDVWVDVGGIGWAQGGCGGYRRGG